MRILHIVICGLPRYEIFIHIISLKHDFRKKKKVFAHKMSVLISSTTFVRIVSHSKKNWARYDKKISSSIHVKYPLFLHDFNET